MLVSLLPAINPLSAVIYEYCGKTQFVILTFTDGTIEFYSQDELDNDDTLMAGFTHMSQKYVIHVASPEICGCSS